MKIKNSFITIYRPLFSLILVPLFKPVIFIGVFGRCRSKKQTEDISALVFLTSKKCPAGFPLDVGCNQCPPFGGSYCGKGMQGEIVSNLRTILCAFHVAYQARAQPAYILACRLLNKKDVKLFDILYD